MTKAIAPLALRAWTARSGAVEPPRRGGVCRQDTQKQFDSVTWKQYPAHIAWSNLLRRRELRDGRVTEAKTFYLQADGPRLVIVQEILYYLDNLHACLRYTPPRNRSIS